MERQAKDGTVYKQVGQDSWEPVTRQSKDGTVFKKVGSDDWAPLEKPKAASKNETSAIEAFGNKAGDGVTMGFGSEIGAALAPAVDWAIEKTTGMKVPEDTYAERVTENDARLATMAKEHPYASGAGTVTGVLGGSMGLGSMMKGAGLIKSSGQLAKGAAGPMLKGSTQLGINTANAAKEGLAYGILADTDTASDGTWADYAKDKLTNTATSAGISSAFPIVGAGLKATSKLPKKLLSSTLGVSEENIGKYLKRSENINAARSVDDIKNDVDEVVRSVREGVESSKLSERDAKISLKSAYEKLKDEAKTATGDASSALKEAKAKLSEASDNLNISFKQEVNTLKNTPAPTHLAGDVVESVGNLKKIVNQGSKEAFEILERESKPISLKGVPQMMDEAAEGLKVEGKFATPSAEGTYQFIKNFQQKLYELPVNITGASAKKIVQQLDDVINYGGPAGQHSPAEQRSLKAVRAKLDELLKTQSPAYREKMAQVAEDTGLLKAAQRRGLGDIHKATSKLSNVSGAGKEQERELIAALGSKLGQDFDGPIAQYTKTKDILKDQLKLEHIKNGLPENEAVRLSEKQVLMAEQKLVQTQASGSTKVLRKSIVESPEAQAARTAKQKLSSAQAEAKNIGGLTENSSEGQIRSQMGRGSIEGQKRLQYVGDKKGKDLVQEIDDLGVKESFDKSFMNGSRNVNLGAILGAAGGVTGRSAIGGAIGYAGGDEVGGSTGAAIGALSGALSNTYGPKMTKVILDQIIKVQKLPAAQQFQALALPQAIKNELPLVLRRLSVAGSKLPETKMPKVAEGENPSPKKGPDKWANDGFKKLLQSATPAQREQLESMKEQLLKPGRARSQLFSASDLKPGSDAMNEVLFKILKPMSANNRVETK